MTNPTSNTAVVPSGWHTVTPRLVARDARALVDFIVHVFSASGQYEPGTPTIVQIGDSNLMVSDEGVRRQTSALLYVYVADLESAYARALERGALSIEAPFSTPYGDRRATVEDAWGNVWQMASRSSGEG